MGSKITHHHIGEIITPQSAYDLTNKAALEPETCLKGVTIISDDPEDISLLYHAATYANLKINGVELKGKKPFFTKRIIALKEREWNDFIFQMNLAKPFTFDEIDYCKLLGIKQPEIKKISSTLPQLNQLIGLREVKKQIHDIGHLMKNRKDREAVGLPAILMSQHLVFTGNPGTGKTTVARLVGKIYQQYGVLKKGHFIEVEGRDLIAEYIGQTAAKTKKVINSALDGVLFIDEAYALAQSKSKNDFGKEAITTLIKMMEDHRDRLVIIIAGYDNEIEVLLNSNPGLKSRFKTTIDFPDYQAEELSEIFMLLCKESSNLLTPEAKQKVNALFATMHKHKNEHFGNGRAVRNVFEQCVLNQARRLGSNKRPSLPELRTVMQVDVPNIDNIKL